MLVRVLYAWDGNQKPYAPNTIIDMDDAAARERMQAGHVEAIGKSDASRLYGWNPDAPVVEEAAAEPAPPTDSGQDHGDEGGFVDSDEPAAAPSVETPLDDLTRAELNALAVETGVESPERQSNRGAVIAAIVEARTAPADIAEADEE